MATASRALWKGAISFGLVHIPVSLHPATREGGLDFDWLDKRTMDPVGYRRINKKTGKEVTKDDIVKGIEYEDGRYVVLSGEEISAAFPKSTQSIDIEGFVGAAEIPFVYLDRPYYLAPVGKGDKVYALLRETLLKTGRIGLARVVIQTKQHLAALVPAGRALVLSLLRWGDEIRPSTDLDLPAEGVKAAGLTERELKMAEQLVADMATTWQPEEYRNVFKDQVLAIVEQKAEAGETEAVLEPAEVAPGKGAEIIDLTELLQRSLGKRRPEKDAAEVSTKPAASPRKKVAASSRARKPAARKRAA